MTMRHLPTLLVLTVSTLTVPARTQALGNPTPFLVNIDVTAGNAGGLGIARSVDSQGGNERFWVSARAPALSGAHVLYEYNRAGQRLNTYNQLTSYGTPSVWGLRDLAFDGTHIYGGQEVEASGVWVVPAFDVTTRQWDPARAITLPNGSFPAGYVVRAIAYRPSTDTFFTSNFAPSGTVYEFNRAGIVVNTIVMTTGVPSGVYGLAYEAGANKLWIFGQSGDHDSNRDVGVVAGEIDLNATPPIMSGTRFWGEIRPSRVPTLNLSATRPTVLGGIAGGLDFYTTPAGSFFAVFAQSTQDYIYEIEGPFVTGQSCGGAIGMNDEPYLSNASWQVDFIGLGASAIQTIPILGFAAGDIDLSGAGLTGCRFLVGFGRPVIFLSALPVSGGIASLPFPLPSDPTLSYAPVFFQALTIDPGAANPFGLTLTRRGGTVLY